MDEQESYEHRLLTTRYNRATNRLEKSRATVQKLTEQVEHQKQSINHMSAELGKLKRKQKHATS